RSWWKFFIGNTGCFASAQRVQDPNVVANTVRTSNGRAHGKKYGLGIGLASRFTDSIVVARTPHWKLTAVSHPAESLVSQSVRTGEFCLQRAHRDQNQWRARR